MASGPLPRLPRAVCSAMLPRPVWTGADRTPRPRGLLSASRRVPVQDQGACCAGHQCHSQGPQGRPVPLQPLSRTPNLSRWYCQHPRFEILLTSFLNKRNKWQHQSEWVFPPLSSQRAGPSMSTRNSSQGGQVQDRAGLALGSPWPCGGSQAPDAGPITAQVNSHPPVCRPDSLVHEAEARCPRWTGPGH